MDNAKIQARSWQLKTIKEILDYEFKNEKWVSQIGYILDDVIPKPMLISDIFSMIYALDVVQFPDHQEVPFLSVTDPKAVFFDYLEHQAPDFYLSMLQDFSWIPPLWNLIENELPKFMLECLPADLVLAQLKPYQINADHTHRTRFFGGSSEYQLPTAYVYPFFSAFRALINFEPSTKQITWQWNPLTLWLENAKQLVPQTFSHGFDPKIIAQDRQLWQNNYKMLQIRAERLKIDPWDWYSPLFPSSD